MKRLLLLILIVSYTTISYAQKEANYWYFGNKAGLDFATGNPLPVAGSQLNTLEGCSSFSDVDGNLLFYVGAPTQTAKNLTVWNKNNQPMPYCDTLNGGVSLLGDASSSQSALTIPDPANPNRYYLFTVGANSSGNAGFWYYTIDMTADGGLGDIIAGPIDLSNGNSNNWSEKITAVRGFDCNTFWVISLERNNFYAYKVSASGVDIAGVVTSNVPSFPNGNERRGYMKVSPAGNKLAVAKMNNGAYLLDFDTTTGVVSNSVTIDTGGQDPYGVEFSRSSNILYVSTGQYSNAWERLYQYDLTQSDIASINASRYLVHQDYNSRGAIQLGPDSKIYWTRNGKSNLSVINDPEVLGNGCNYSNESVNLGTGLGSQGLPPFISSLLAPVDIQDNDNSTIVNNNTIDICAGSTKSWSPTVVVGSNIKYTWTYDDLNGNITQISTNPNLTLSNMQPSETGLYILKVDLTDGCGTKTLLEGRFNVNVFSVPLATKPTDLQYCDDNNDGYYGFDFTSGTSAEILNGQSTADMEVKYFTSQADADANTNAIALPYNNSNPFIPETIYARVHNIAAPTICFATTNFTIDVNKTPIPTTPSNYELCDDISSGNDTDGFTSNFILSSKDNEILGSLNASQFTISYHKTLLDAQNNNNAINKNIAYQNTIANTQKIYVRIENNDNTNCADTSISFDLIVNPLPIVANATLQVCDTDIDGYTTIDLTQAEPQLSANALNESFNYFPTQLDAINNSNSLANPSSFINRTINSDTVWVRIISSSNCFRIAEVSIWVNTTSVPNTFMENLELCDDFLDSTGSNNINNNDTDGITSFDLRNVDTKLKNIYNSGQAVSISYHETQADGLANIRNISDLSNHRNISSPNVQIIYARVQSLNSSSCLGVYPVATLKVNTTPSINTVGNLTLSDDDNDGDIRNGIVQNFNLDSQTSSILGGLNPASFTVTYHDTRNDASLGTNALSSPFTNTIAYSQNIYVRVTNNLTGCYNDHTEFKTLVTPVPYSYDVNDIIVCDDDTDGSANNGLVQNIDLNSQTSTILGSQDPLNFAVTYHSSKIDATNNINPLNSPFSNSTKDLQTIYVRVTDLVKNTFNDLNSFDIIVNTEPIISTPPNLEICDDNSDGSATNGLSQSIDLTVQNSKILNGLNPADYTISYHPSKVDADFGTNIITTPYSNTTPFNEIIFIRTINNTTGCVNSKISFNIVVNPEPIPSPVTNLYLSDNDLDGDFRNGLVQTFDLNSQTNDILGALNPINFTVSYHASQFDATNAINPLTSPFANSIKDSQNIFVRLTNNSTGCFNDQLQFQVIVNPKPLSNTVENLEVCDNDNDGSATNGFAQNINLNSQTSTILGSQDPANFIVSYHASKIDATNNSNSISSPFSNTTKDKQTIFVRVTNTLTNTFIDNNSFDVIVNTEPLISVAPNLEVCDNILDGSATNGYSQNIDLSIQNNLILGALNPSDYTITYHLSKTDAELGTNILASPFTNTTPYSQTIFVRAFNKTTGCVNSRTSFNVIINPEPISNAVHDLEVCDDDLDGSAINGFSQNINLESQNSSILGSQSPTDFKVTYHLSKTDATSGANSLSSPFTNTFSGTQTIYVRVLNKITSCINDHLTFNVKVNPTPTISNVADLEICDDDADGSAINGLSQSINLNNQTNAILGGLSPIEYSVSYYNSKIDAELGNNPLNQIYSNTNPFSETIFVRVENNTTGCANTDTQFNINITKQPEANLISNFEICDSGIDGSTINGFEQNIDLESLSQNILGTQNKTDFKVTYHTSQIDAINNNNPIISPFSNSFAFIQTIYVRVTQIKTGCFNAETNFNLSINSEPYANAVPDIIICDDDLDGSASNLISQSIDLEQQTAGILGSQLASDFIITYHQSQADASSNSNPLSSPFTNTIVGTQKIFVRVTNKATSCFNDNLSFNVIINPLPIINPISDLEICDNSSDGDPRNGFIQNINLTEQISSILGTQDPANFNVSFHLNQSDADSGNNSINSPFSNSVKDRQEIFIRLVNNTTGCSTANQSFFININSEPNAFTAPDIEVCNTDTPNNSGASSIQEIDLSNQASFILGNQSNSEFIVTYHDSQSDAELNINPLAINYKTSLKTNKTIYVRVENILNGCFNTGSSFNIIFNPQPTANALPDLLICDNGSDGDTRNGFAQNIDFTVQTSELLGSQHASLYKVSYFRSLLDATNNTNPIISPFTNTIKDQQTIYTRIENKQTGCANTSVNFELIISPEPTIEMIDAMQIEDDDNDGSFYTGFSQSIDLESNNQKILGSQNINLFTVTYHKTLADAAIGNRPLTSPYSNTTSFKEIIFARVTNKQTGCASFGGFFEININPKPFANTITDIEFCDDALDGNDRNGKIQNINLDSEISSILGANQKEEDFLVTFHSSQQDANNGINPLVDFENSANPQQIFVRILNKETQTTNTQTSFMLRVKALPIIEVISPDYICVKAGKTTLSVQNPTAAYEYSWTDEAGTDLGNSTFIEVTKKGKYFVTAIGVEDNSCSKTETIIVKESDIAVIEKMHYYIVDDSDNNSIVVNNENQILGIGNYEFALSDTDGIIVKDFQDSGTFENLAGGIYHLLIRDKNGCGQITMVFSILTFPRFFTPNNDGNNDFWNINGITSYYVKAKVSIYNRYGQIIGVLVKDENNNWDGTSNGKIMPSNDYWYNAELEDREGNIRIKRGNFSLIRN